MLDAADRRARGQVQAIRWWADVASTQCFRTHLQTCVKYVSPVAYDFVTAAGIGFDDLLHELRPGPAWLRRKSGKQLLAARAQPGLFGRSASDINPIYDYHADWLAPAQAIAVIRPRSHGFAYVGIRVVGEAVELIASIGNCHISTQGGVAWLILDQRLPETLKIGCIDRPIGELIDNHLLSEREYKVCEVFDLGNEGPTVLSFRTGLIARAMPWPETCSD